jgi:hypothetical protein
MKTLIILFALLVSSPALAAECTHDLARQAVTVLQMTGTGYPTLPNDIADTGSDAGIPYIETLPSEAVSRVSHNVLAARHWTDALRLALVGQCGEPLTTNERGKASDLVNRFEPWEQAWDAAIPLEQTRRAADKSAASHICEASEGLRQAQARLAFERANPSGVVSLQELHTEGQLVQVLTQVLIARKRLFQRDRGKAFASAMCPRP